MSFTVQDYADLVRLLSERPEWRQELRRLLLTDDLLTLPGITRELAEAQRRTEERLEALAEAQKRTEERLEALIEAQKRTEERLEALAQAQLHTEERLARLEAVVEQIAAGLQTAVARLDTLQVTQQHLVDTVGGMRGRLLELAYRDKAGAYFGRLLRHLKVIELHALDERLEAALSREEFEEVLLLDLLVTGQPRYQPELREVWLAVEVSSVVDEGDVERAKRRAELLRRAGYRALPTVAGEHLTLRAEDAARAGKVVVLQDGRSFLWEEALKAWAA